MDELELLKKDWQRKGEILPKLSYNEIYRMIWKRSSSIVKWMYYISLMELALFIVLGIAPFFWEPFEEKFTEAYGDGKMTFMIVLTLFSTVVIFVFIYYLYKAYKSISAADNVRGLMERILHTRKIVHYYIGYNLVMAVIVTIHSCYDLYQNDERTQQLLSSIKENGSELRFWVLSALMLLVGIVLMVGFIWLFYRLIYGILLKRLKKNYKELERLEV